MIWAKTGWARYNGINLGWGAGYLETGENVYFFATRIHQKRKAAARGFSRCPKEITYSAFKALGILKP